MSPGTGTPSTAGRAGRYARAAILFLLALIAVGSARKYRERFDPGNETGRVHAAMAIVDHGSVHLEDVWDDVYPHWRTKPDIPNGDASAKDGHYLLDKPPGITLLMVPVVALMRATGTDLGLIDLLSLLAVLIVALPTALYLLAFLRWIRRNLGDCRPALLAAPAVILATPWLLFASQVVGHALAACLCGLGAMLALGGLAREEPEGELRKGAFLGGLALGGAVLTESSSALVVLAVLLALLVDPGRRRRLPRVILGGVGPALVFLTWNTLCFGNPLTSGYAYKVTPSMAAAHERGLFGLAVPGAEGFFGLLISARRGLFYLSPWLLLGPVGAVWSCFDRRITRAWKVLLVLGTVLVPVMLTGFSDWHGGQTLGPRYLVFILPIFGIAAAVAAERLTRRRAGAVSLPCVGGLALSSLVLLLLANAGIPAVVVIVTNPVAEVVLPVLFTAGPLGTWWDPLTGPIVGTVLAVLAAIAVTFLAIRWTPETGNPAPRQGKRLTAAALVLLAMALHFAVIPIERTREQRGQATVLRARWFSYLYMGREDLRRELEPEIIRLERR